MHDIYLKTTQIIHNRNNLAFLSSHAASTNFERGFQECITKNEKFCQHYSVLKNATVFNHSFKKRCSKIVI